MPLREAVKRDPSRPAAKFITEAISEVFSGALGPEYAGRIIRFQLNERKKVTWLQCSNFTLNDVKTTDSSFR
jgi:hypothetical protein